MSGIKKELLLSIKNLAVEYTSDDQIIKAVNGVSLDIKQGETLGLVGETGAGKTTIAKSILRILPEFSAKIKGGEILFEGKNILKMNNRELRKIRGHKISMIFQDPMTALNPVMRGGEQIAEVIQLHKRVNKKEAEEQAAKMLESVGISADRFREYPHQFSGGMRQRVVIAMALACDPVLLLADEPTTALDVTIQAQVLELINRLKKERNTSMMLITHDLGIVSELCDSVAVIYAGEIVEYGSKEDIFENPSHPYTLGLFGALPDANKDADRLKPIRGMMPDPSNLPAGCKFHPRCPYATEKCSKTDVDMFLLGDAHLCRCIYAEFVKEKAIKEEKYDCNFRS